MDVKITDFLPCKHFSHRCVVVMQEVWIVLLLVTTKPGFVCLFAYLFVMMNYNFNLDN